MRAWIWILFLMCCLAGILNGFQVTGVGQADAFVGPDPHVIPSDALRLRIIANSNSPVDQNLKREIRNQVIALIGERMANVTSLPRARIVLTQAVPQVEAIAAQMVKNAGMSYGANTTFGPASFPTKLYGNRVYPAGIYQALRITLGIGAGQNWWCVLFPPLCFVALTDGDAIAATKAFPDYPPLAINHIVTANGKRVPVALRLAIVDYGEQFGLWIGATFSELWRQVALIV